MSNNDGDVERNAESIELIERIKANKDEAKEEEEIRKIIRKAVNKPRYLEEHIIETYYKLVMENKTKKLEISPARLLNLSQGGIPFAIISIYGGISKFDAKSTFDNLYSRIFNDLFESFTDWGLWLLTDGISEDVSSLINQAVYENNILTKTELNYTTLNVIGITEIDRLKKRKNKKMILAPNHHIYVLYNEKKKKNFRKQFQIDLLEHCAKECADMEEDYEMMVFLFINGNSHNINCLKDIILNTTLPELDNGTYEIVLVKGWCPCLDYLCDVYDGKKVNLPECITKACNKEEIRSLTEVAEKIGTFKPSIKVLTLDDTQINLANIMVSNMASESLKNRKLKLTIKTLGKEQEKIEIFLRKKYCELSKSRANLKSQLKNEKGILFKIVKYSLMFDRADILKMLLKKDKYLLKYFLTKKQFLKMLKGENKVYKMLVKLKGIEDFENKINVFSQYSIDICFYSNKTDNVTKKKT